MQIDIDLSIPDFLDRKLHPEIVVEWKPEIRRQRAKKLTPKQETENELRRIAIRRQHTTPTVRRPRLSRLIKEVRAEFKAKGCL